MSPRPLGAFFLIMSFVEVYNISFNMSSRDGCTTKGFAFDENGLSTLLHDLLYSTAVLKGCVRAFPKADSNASLPKFSLFHFH